MGLSSYRMSFKLPAFPVDPIMLAAWAVENVANCLDSVCDSKLKIDISVPWTNDLQTPIKTYIASLTQSGEAAKLALPHSLSGVAYQTWIAQVQNVAANAATPSATQKLLMMGAVLTPSQMDSLPTN